MRTYNNQDKNKKFERPEGLQVFVRDGNVEKALRQLKKKVKNAGLVQEIKDRQHFIPKSEKKRLARNAGKKRWLKKLAKSENDY
jgi:small subunit ribosomal protein S21|tara:strand:- start:958 stop:1209 length:252 start_codon:yes stop_codon:yes gene_type:complete